MARSASAYALAANDLLTGALVFWSQEARWCSDFNAALFSEDGSSLEPLGAAEEAANRVVGAALVPVNAARQPIELRDQRRLQGVTLPLRTTQSERAPALAQAA
jgi:hypothetical protein